jgi:hypothetical protein
MGATTRKSAFWEKTMSSTLKMFLIIEQKDASGMEIRMAHPPLAKAVLSQILENNKENLKSLKLRVLENFSSWQRNVS